MFDRTDQHKAILDGLSKQQDAAAKALAVDVKAVVTKQCGEPILVGVCPDCHTRAGLSEPAPTNGEGLHFCRRCHALLRFVA